jgi:hypothetical protein
MLICVETSGDGLVSCMGYVNRSGGTKRDVSELVGKAGGGEGSHLKRHQSSEYKGRPG